MNREKFDEQFARFSEMCEQDGRFAPTVEQQIPVLDEDTNWTHADWDYVLHTNWAARVLARTKPKRHVDIGSYSYFATLCSAFIPNFEFYDVRPLGLTIPGLKMDSCNLTNLHFPDNSIESLSTLHVIEHIGLARYGDKLNAQGDILAARELMRVLAPGGQLLIVAPMNQEPRINFNAHRIYSALQLMALFPGMDGEDANFLSNGGIWPFKKGIPASDFTMCVRLIKP